MTGEQIRARIFLPQGLALAALLAAGVFGARWLQERTMTARVRETLGAVETGFHREIEEDAQLLAVLLDLLRDDGALQEAWLARDRDVLLRAASPIFEKLRDGHRVTHFYFVDVERTCFLRVHNPPRHGDRIDRVTMAEAARTGKPAHGIELGTFGTFTLRVVYPWRIGGQLVGYIELGEEIEHITPELKEGLGVELFFTIAKPHLQRPKWEEGLAMMGRAGRWDEFDRVVIIDRTLAELPQAAAGQIGRAHAEHAGLVFRCSIGARRYRGGYVRLADAAGRDVGDIVALVDVTEERAALHTLVVVLTVGSIAAGVFLGGFFWVFLGRVQGRLLDARGRLEAEVEARRQREAALEQAQQRFMNEMRQREQAEACLERQVAELLQARRAALNITEDLERENAQRKASEEELRSTLATLEQFNRLAVGREERMIELKREVNEMARRAEAAPPYDLAFAHSGRQGRDDA